MKRAVFTLFMLIFLSQCNMTFAQQHRDDSRERIRELEEKNRELEKRMQFLEAHMVTLENYIKLLVGSNFDGFKKQEIHYSITFKEIGERDFEKLHAAVKELNIEYFDYNAQPIMGGLMYIYTGEIGCFTDRKDAMMLKSKLPKSIKYEIVEYDYN